MAHTPTKLSCVGPSISMWPYSVYNYWEIIIAQISKITKHAMPGVARSGSQGSWGKLIENVCGTDTSVVPGEPPLWLST